MSPFNSLPRFCFPAALLLIIAAVSVSAQTTNTNTVTNGGLINVGDTQIITNPVTLISAAITNDGSLQFWQTTALTNSGVISGSGSLTKASGSGNLILSGSNTFSGKVTVSSGTLTATGVSDSAGSGLGQGTQVELGSGAALGVTVSSGTNSTTRQLIVNGNFTLANTGNGALVWSGNLVNNSAGNNSFFFNSAGTGTNEFAGAIGNGTSGALNLNFQNTQIWRLSGSNTFTGGITIGGGKVIAMTISNTGTASSVGSGGTIRFGYFDNAPTTFEYAGSGSTNDRQIKLGASAGSNNNTAFLLQNGSGALVFTNTTFTLSGDVGTTNVNRRLVLGGTNTLDNAITGRILDNVTGNGTAAVFSNSTITIVKDGAGKWILAGSNSYTGGTVISNGTLQIGNAGTSGSVLGAITNNAALVFNRSDAVTVSNAISGTGTVTKASGSGNLTLSGNNTFSGKVTVSSGTLNATSVADSGSSSLGTGTQLELGQGARLALNATGSVSTSRQLIMSGTTGGSALESSGTGAVVWSGNLVNQTSTNSGASFLLTGTSTAGNEFAGVISNSAAGSLRLIKSAEGTWKLSGSNTFSGGMDIQGGTIMATTLGDSGSASSLGSGGTIRMGGFGVASTLDYVGSGSTNNRQFKLGSGGSANDGGTILNNGSGALAFTNTTFNTAGDGPFANTTRALTLGGSNTAANTISGRIQDNNAGANTNNAVSVVKTGSGKWVLSGSNTYSGTTTVSAGSLIINGNNSGATGALSVASGATLGGSGTIGGATTISGTLAPGNSIGTLTVANDVTWNGGENWIFELGAVAGPSIASPGSSDFLSITGAGSDFLKGSGSSWTFDFAGTGDFGWYKLVAWSGGTTTFDALDFTGVNLGGVYTSEFAIQDNALYVNVVPEPSAYALLGLAALGFGAHVLRRRQRC